jgi:hypothetical protein
MYSFRPISSIRGRMRFPLYMEDLMDENVYEDVWLPLGDDKETDVLRLLEQTRIRK